MDAGDGQRREHPDLLVVHEQMRASAPVLLITVEGFEILDVLQRQSIRALRQGGRRRVVQRDEGWSPSRPLQRLAIGIEILGRKAFPDNTLPVGHYFLQIARKYLPSSTSQSCQPLPGFSMTSATPLQRRSRLHRHRRRTGMPRPEIMSS